MTARLRDVTLRDGLQLTGGMMPTDEKVRLVRELLEVGVSDIEIGSMARPDLVPPLASGPYVIDKVDLGRTITYKRKQWQHFDKLKNEMTITAPTLHGLLKKIRDLGMVLVSVNRVSFDETRLHHSKKENQ